MSIETSDAEYWRVALTDDGDSFAAVFDRHQHRVFRHSLALVPAGTVVSPGDGTTVTRGSAVAVVTSNGALVDMPDVLGSEAGAASSTLTTAGFAEVRLVCVALGDTEPGVGTVVSSNPAAGAAARTSDGATLGVGKAAC